MEYVTLTFHGKLNDFLPGHPPDEPIRYRFDKKIAVKHIIEVIGVPHPEVGKILVDGQPVDLLYAVMPDDNIQIFPRTAEDNHIEGQQPAFILDNHLGKLADYMRLLGLDTVYAWDWPDEQIARVAHDDQRILLTRDRGLLKRKIVRDGYCVRADDPAEQLAEVVEQFGLNDLVKPFQRCPRCNGTLKPVKKADIIDQLLPLTRKYYDEFSQCTSCGQIYWKGSHYNHMQTMLKPYLHGQHEDS